MKVVARQIDMVASFRKNGSIVPRKFRLADDENWDTAKVIKVDRVISTDETRLAGVKTLIFSCASVIEGSGADGGVERLYEIKYRVDEHRWELYKMER